ncbi:MAG: T9SS type A sorting domain-containing protein [Bacteroidota bacterium]
MRKSLLIITSFCFGIVSANAQITITTADMPVATKIQYHSNDTVPTISIGNSDTIQTWNFTAVTQHTVDTSTVFPYASVPNTAFSSATMAVQQGSANFYGYLLNSPSALTLLGGSGVVDIQGSPIAVNQINTPGEILFNFPTSFDSSFTNNYSTSAKFFFGQQINGFYIDSVHQRSRVEKSFVVDAYGTLTTLLGGPYNVLRVKEIKEKHDTTQAFFFGGWNDIPGGITSSFTTTYSWWANGIGSALAKATVDTNGTVTNLEWLTALPSDPLLAAAAMSTNVSCEGTCDGSSTVTATWGVPPYTYSWSTSPAQNSATASALCVGSYTVTVTDSVSATATAVVTISNPEQPTISANGLVLSTTYPATTYQWVLNDSALVATTQNFTVTQNGSYTLVVSYGSGCTDTSLAYNFNNIGIVESALINSVKVSPNPATNSVTIAFNFGIASQQTILVDIKNELGQSVKKVNVNQLANGKNEMLVDIADLPKGIYFIQIQGENSIINKKLIKQ